MVQFTPLDDSDLHKKILERFSKRSIIKRNALGGVAFIAILAVYGMITDNLRLGFVVIAGVIFMIAGSAIDLLLRKSLEKRLIKKENK